MEQNIVQRLQMQLHNSVLVLIVGGWSSDIWTMNTGIRKMCGHVETVPERCDKGVPADCFVLNINKIINCTDYPTLH